MRVFRQNEVAEIIRIVQEAIDDKRIIIRKVLVKPPPPPAPPRVRYVTEGKDPRK